MKSDIRNKIKRFLESEVGRVSIKAPLALGIASGSFLLAQAIIAPSAEAGCSSDDDCAPGERCDPVCIESSSGTCVQWSNECS